METIHYLLISTICLSISYLAYLVIARNEKNFKQLRFFLLSSIIISLLIPLSNFQINIPQQVNLPVISSQEFISTPEKTSPTNLSEMEATELVTLGIKSTKTSNTTSWSKILKFIYVLIAAYLVFRILLQISKLIYYSVRAEKKNTGKETLIFSDKIKHPSSFFRWIFLPKENLSEDKEFQEIITHEKIHVSQYHSIDNLLIELLSAVMWFNPLVWMMRNSIQLVHEYLADEGVLVAGADKNKYQALLLNQVAEERLVSLSSNFNQSLIKKRMIMMTKSKIYKRSKTKILFLIPVAAILFFGVACVKGQEKSANKPTIDNSKPEALYVGVDNPLNLDLSMYENPSVKLVSNGHLRFQENSYYLRPEKIGNLFIELLDNSKTVSVKEYIVKPLPDSLKGKSSNTGINNVVTAVAPTRMNVLYLGVDNPVAIASSGHEASELEVSIDNGRIVGENGNYIVNPAHPGNAFIIVKKDGKVIQESEFRVKTVPDPFVGIPIVKENKTTYLKGGATDKNTLVTEIQKTNELVAFMQNFDFDLEFDIIKFNITGVLVGFLHEIPSNKNKFTQKQIEFINKLSKGDLLTITDIYAVGPDGVERELNPIIFRLNAE